LVGQHQLASVLGRSYQLGREFELPNCGWRARERLFSHDELNGTAGRFDLAQGPA
jgi:hypothetical protein